MPSLKRKSEQVKQKTIDEQNAALLEYLQRSGTAKVVKPTKEE